VCCRTDQIDKKIVRLFRLTGTEKEISLDVEAKWGDLGVDGWIILGMISRRWDVGIWTGLSWPRIETGGGHL
jgi:hypothetical protein